MNTRSKGPRRVIAEAFRRLRADLDSAAFPWTNANASRVFDDGPSGGYWRKRTPAELPENSVGQWDQLAWRMSQIIRQAKSIHEAAMRQAEELRRIASEDQQ